MTAIVKSCAAFLAACSVSILPPLRADGLPNKASPQTIRCAVIGGMMDTGFWPALAERFEKAAGLRIEVVFHGPKEVIIPVFRRGEADVIVMHSSDAMINLVADGYGVDPQPWAKNDLLIVGPPSDPAGIRGMTDAAEALRRITATESRLLIQRSLGAQQVLRDMTELHRVALDWTHVTVKLDDPDREMLKTASALQAYAIVGRIPFRNGKIPNCGMEVMVQGDPRLRRPYLVVVVDPRRVAPARAEAARRLAHFLREKETQAWIANYGRGVLDDQPFFFPVQLDAAPASGDE